MTRNRSLSLATVILLSWCLPGPSVDAQSPLPFAARTSIGPRSADAQAAVSVDGEETLLSVAVGRSRAEARVRGITSEATVESVSTSAGRVVVVRATGPTQIAALFAQVGAQVRLVWSGRLDLHGDPGERWADAIEIADRTGDGEADVVVGVIREGLAPCGGPPALLAPRALVRSGELRSVELARGIAHLPDAPIPMVASIGRNEEALLSALRFSGATSTAGIAEPLLASPPRALTDGNLATAWAEGRPGDGSGELLVGAWEADVPLTGLRFRAGTSVALPREVSIHVGGQRHRVSLEGAGGDAWVRFPEPVAGSCVTVIVERGAEGALPTGFAEITAYTPYDDGEGIGGLIDELVAEGPRADRVAGWLARMGAPACAALEEAWERLGAQGRLRAVRVAGSATGERCPHVLSRAATDDGADVRQEALRAMVLDRAFDGVASLALASGTAGDDAALALGMAEQATLSDPGALWAALSSGTDRPALRLAAARLAAASPEAARAFATTASPSALAALTLGLTDDRLGPRGRDERRALAAEISQGALAATAFPDRYRLAIASADLPRPAALDAWLGEQARGAEEWMQRAAALTALGEAADDTVLASALADAYPRVRVLAIAIAGRKGRRDALTHALSDGWPMVRAAALVGLDDASSAAAALDDDVALVRVAALEILTRHGAREAWPAIEERLGDRDEWPEVVRAALRYVAALCLPEAAAALENVVQRGARDGAWAPDVEVAIDALGVAFRIGGEAAERARRAATSGGASVADFEPALAREASMERCAAPPP